MRLAYFSPLPPTRSGIADYSAELLPHLTLDAQIELFVDETRPTPEAIHDHNGRPLRVRLARDYPRARQTGSFDAALYQMGNHSYHSFVYDSLVRYPGVTVLHEPFLHHLVVARTVRLGDEVGYLREMAYALGPIGIRRATEALRHTHRFPYFEYPLCDRVIDSSLGIITHSEFAAAIVRARRPDARIAVIRHHIVLTVTPENLVGATRRAVGVGEDDLLISSFGLATPEKRLDLALSAFRAVHDRYPRAVFAVVGEVSSNLDLNRMIAELGLGDSVRVTGYVSKEQLLAQISATDIGLCLRSVTLGETSGALLRLLSAGRASIVLDIGAFSEYPDDCLRKIPIDGHESEGLTSSLLDLASNPDVRLSLGERARAYVSEHNSIDKSAAAYIAFVNDTLGR